MPLCRRTSGGTLRKIVMTSSSWSLEGEDITIVETSGAILPTTRRHTPEDAKPTKFNVPKFCVLPTQCIYVFRMALGTNSDYFPIQH